MDESSKEKRTNEQNVPLEDVDATARAQGTTRAKVLQNMAGGSQAPQDVTHTNQDGLSQEYDSDQLQSNPSDRQDGYSETQGTGYGQSQNNTGQPADAKQAQNDYDPTHSGVRHAQNRPGTRPPTPGRETGTSWGEDQQMGETTDTPDRKNPAG
jgi:hypothetical protein